MAADEALLQCATRQIGSTVLRFYQWQAPTLSLGYFQRYEERFSHHGSQSCPLVRRSTGGGAILHDQEWTYSLVVNSTERFHASTIYHDVHQSLVAVLALHGVHCQMVDQTTPTNEPSPFLCFQRRSAGDVVLAGQKILGSAQRRVGGFVLQHGSLLLRRSKFAAEIPGLCDLINSETPIRAIRDEWIENIMKRWGRVTQPSDWTDEERNVAQTWQDIRFEQQKWSQKR